MINTIRNELHSLANRDIASHSQRFFKTGKGEYGEGDRFLGIRVPVLRGLVKKYRNKTTRPEALKLLKSPYHEERLLALLLLVDIYNRTTEEEKKKTYEAYLGNTSYINNWDLVDCSAEHIIGEYLFKRDREPLYILSESKLIWERRIAIMSTFHFIKNNDFKDALKISEILLNDKEDLIHKAVGWMLREVGKRDLHREESFLIKHYKNFPRTMLRYAIERFPEGRRKKYLRGEI